MGSMKAGKLPAIDCDNSSQPIKFEENIQQYNQMLKHSLYNLHL